MKVILSRKGLDSSFGNVSSLILPDGKMCWLPIPEIDEEKELYQYKDLMFDGYSLGKVITDLSSGKISQNTTVHLDPDIFPFYVDRDLRWYPLFGQTGAAESHLRNCNVGPGDIFLFFGWFKYVELSNGRYRYVSQTPDLHVLYGWFQIRDKARVSSYTPTQSWMRRHTHFQGDKYSEEFDTVYFPTKNLILNGKITDLAGCGYFPRIHTDLILTAPTQNRSVWKLPKWFYPEIGKKPLSYHNKLSRWTQNEDCVILKSVGRGQEFVLDAEDYPQSVSWIESMIGKHGMGVF